MIITISALTAIGSRALLLCTVVLSLSIFIFSLFNERLKKSLYLPFISFAVIISCVLLLLSINSYNKAVSYADKTCTVRAILKETPQFSKENNRYYCKAKIITINGNKSASDIKLSFKEKPNIYADNEILFDGYIYKTGSSIKSIENNYKSDRLYIGCYNIKNIKVTNDRFKGYYHFTERLKNYIESSLHQSTDSKTAGLMISFLTGDKAHLDKEIYENFSRSGVSHLMAVSGLHLSVWILALGFLLEKINKKNKVFPYITMITAVVLIMIIASFSGSVKRAGFMCILHLAGKILSQKSDSLNNLGFSVAFILILNPYSVFDTGFLLSFLSTASIIVFAIPTSERIIKRASRLPIYIYTKKLSNPVIKSIMISSFIFVCTLPVVALKFGYISTMSVVTNLLFLPFSFIMILVAGLLVITNPIGIISKPLAFIASLLSRYAFTVTDYIADFRYAVIPANRSIVIPWLLIICLITFLLLNKRVTRVTVKSVSASILMLCIAFSALTFHRDISSYKLHIIPAENKIAVMLTMNSKGILIGYHDSYYFDENVLNSAKKNNIDIVCMICSQSRRAEDFAKINDIDYIITSSSTCVDVMNTVSIRTDKNKIIIEGNESIFQITDESYLQYNDKYDIIQVSSLKERPADNKCDYISVSNDSSYTIQAFPKGKIRTGGDHIG